MEFLKKLNFLDCKFIDLTHTLSEEIPTWDYSCGFNAKIVSDYDNYADEVKFRVQHIHMHAGIGTHIDAPAHCFSDQTTIENIPLNKLIVPCVMIDVSKNAHENYQISPDDIATFEAINGIIPKEVLVIFYTGWSKLWKTPQKYCNNHHFPSLSKSAAELLLTREVAGIAIDTLSPDCFGSNFPVHKLMLSAEKYIIENIANANLLPAIGAYIIALPLKIKGGTESPLRVVGVIIGK